MSNFRVGDRIKHDNGWTGTIKEIDNFGTIKIKPDNPGVSDRSTGLYHTSKTYIKKIAPDYLSITKDVVGR